MAYLKKRIEIRLMVIFLSIKYVFSRQKNELNTRINRLILLENVVKTSYKISKITQNGDK